MATRSALEHWSHENLEECLLGTLMWIVIGKLQSATGRAVPARRGWWLGRVGDVECTGVVMAAGWPWSRWRRWRWRGSSVGDWCWHRRHQASAGARGGGGGRGAQSVISTGGWRGRRRRRAATLEPRLVVLRREVASLATARRPTLQACDPSHINLLPCDRLDVHNFGYDIIWI